MPTLESKIAREPVRAVRSRSVARRIRNALLLLMTLAVCVGAAAYYRARQHADEDAPILALARGLAANISDAAPLDGQPPPSPAIQESMIRALNDADLPAGPIACVAIGGYKADLADVSGTSAKGILGYLYAQSEDATCAIEFSAIREGEWYEVVKVWKAEAIDVPPNDHARGKFDAFNEAGSQQSGPLRIENPRYFFLPIE